MSENKQVQARPVDRLKMILKSPSIEEQFQNALKENASLFASSLIELFAGDSYLQTCSPQLVVMEALKAATLRLPLNKNLGFAWIIPYKGKPQFQLGWRGIVQLALRTGQYRNINCGPVFEGELKRIDKLSGALDLTGVATSDVEIGYFAFFELVNGYTKVEYWTREKVENHAIKYNQECKKAKALVGNWKEHFSKRASSTVLKHLIKNYGIMSVEMEDAFRKADSNDSSVFDAEYTEMANTEPLESTPIVEPTSKEIEEVDPETGEVTHIEPITEADDDPPFPVG